MTMSMNCVTVLCISLTQVPQTRSQDVQHRGSKGQGSTTAKEAWKYIFIHEQWTPAETAQKTGVGFPQTAKSILNSVQQV